MESKMSKAVAISMAVITGFVCADSIAKGRPSAVRYPAALHGVWLGEGREYCKLPDSLDSDARFEISSAKLIGYEHWNKPLRIVQISKEPIAWKVISQTNFDGKVFDLEEIYVLSGYKNGVLTIVNIDQSKTYDRCD